MSAKIIFLLLAMSTLIGCAPADSLNSVLTDKDIIFDQGLLGMWTANDESPGDGYILFEKAGENGYHITMTGEEGYKREYDAHLGYVHGQRFLDIVLVQDAAQWTALAGSDLTIPNGLANTRPSRPPMVKLGDARYLEFTDAASNDNKTHFKLNLDAAHWVCKVATEAPLLHLDCLDDDWLRDHVDDPAVHLEHELSANDPNGVLITASTGDLQRFVTEHANDEKAFACALAAKHVSTEK